MREAWQVPLGKYLDECEEQVVAPRILYISTSVRTTYEDALAARQITKRWYERNRWGGLSKKQAIQMARLAGKADHAFAVKQAIREGKPVPPEVIEGLPGAKC